MKAPRIAPLEPPYDPDIAAMLAKWMPPGSDAEPLKLFRTLAVNPELTARMRPLGAGILGHGRIPARERELMIQRTCALAGADYEWGVHATAFGPSVRLSDDDAQAIARQDDTRFSGRDALVLRLATELHETAHVSDDVYADLEAAGYDQAEILELVITAGWYRLISYVINAAGVQAEPWALSAAAASSSP